MGQAFIPRKVVGFAYDDVFIVTKQIVSYPDAKDSQDGFHPSDSYTFYWLIDQPTSMGDSLMQSIQMNEYGTMQKIQFNRGGAMILPFVAMITTFVISLTVNPDKLRFQVSFDESHNFFKGVFAKSLKINNGV